MDIWINYGRFSWNLSEFLWNELQKNMEKKQRTKRRFIWIFLEKRGNEKHIFWIFCGSTNRRFYGALCRFTIRRICKNMPHLDADNATNIWIFFYFLDGRFDELLHKYACNDATIMSIKCIFLRRRFGEKRALFALDEPTILMDI